MAYPHSDALVEAMMETLRQHFAELDRAMAIEAAVQALGIERHFTNYYHCAGCDKEWESYWSCACDDQCPRCGLDHSPYNWVVEGEDDAGA